MKQIRRNLCRRQSYTAGTICSKIILSEAAEGRCLGKQIAMEVNLIFFLGKYLTRVFSKNARIEFFQTLQFYRSKCSLPRTRRL